LDTLKIILKEARVLIRNNRSFSFFISKNKIIIDKINEIYLYNNSVKESVYRLINDITTDILCECGNMCRFIDNNRGYTEFCTKKCNFLNEKRKESINNSFNEKYGGHPMKTELVKDKLKKTMIDKYGHDNIMKYYSENNMVKSPFSSKEVKEKIKKTFEEKYGGHPMQNDDTFEKNLKSRVKFINFTLPSGKLIKTQGYEKYGIDFLLKRYDEDDIINGIKEINKTIGYIYYTYKDKKRKYYADFYIKSENKIYEIKSIWTYNANIEKNLLKKKACEDIGLKFEFLIFNYKGELIKL
jgi:hypothetical protein